jgi:hypothetical protein
LRRSPKKLLNFRTLLIYRDLLIVSSTCCDPRDFLQVKLESEPKLSLPPTLDQAGWEILASSAARLVGVAWPRMKLARRFAAEGAMRTNVVIVSTPSLALSLSFVEAQEPVGVQAF